MRRAEQIVAILLEAAGTKTYVFGRGYPKEGYFFDERTAWKDSLKTLAHNVKPRRSKNQKWWQPSRTEPTYVDVMKVMLGRGYSFVRQGKDGSVEVLTGDGVDRIVTNNRGVDGLEKHFNVSPDSMVIHRVGTRGKKIPKRLGDLLVGYDEPPKSEQGEEPQVPKQGLTQAQRVAQKKNPWQPEANAPHPAGANAPDPNTLQPYPVDVYLGLEVRPTPAGLVVFDVEEGSPAAQAGFQVNDVIEWIGRYHPKLDRYNPDPDRTFGPHRIDTLKEWGAVAGNFVGDQTYEFNVIRGDGRTRLAIIPEYKSSSAGPSTVIPGSEIS